MIAVQITKITCTELVLKDHPIGHKMWSVKTGGLWWQVQLYWNVDPAAKTVWPFKTGGLSWQLSLKTDRFHCFWNSWTPSFKHVQWYCYILLAQYVYICTEFVQYWSQDVSGDILKETMCTSCTCKYLSYLVHHQYACACCSHDSWKNTFTKS